MSYSNKATDDVTESGFISKDKILEYVTQEDIFQLVFGFTPVEHQYVTSPFREDNRPGCWFEYEINHGKLRFKDFADTRVIKGVRMANIDCFDSVMIYYGFPSFYKTLEFIKEKLIDGKDIKHDIKHQLPKNKSVESKKSRVKILIGTRDFQMRDKVFWLDRYGITKQNLIDDMIFPITKFKLFDTKTGDHIFREDKISYAYTEFKDGAKKIYRPYVKGPKRFITNCGADDVGGMNNPIKSGKLLIITKSYKDYRVLRNLGLNVRWLQNEGMFPKENEFWNLISSFDKVIVFFDNDDAGIDAAKKLVDLINFTEINKASYIHLPVNLLLKKIKDPSDLYHKEGKEQLVEFLKINRIL